MRLAIASGVESLRPANYTKHKNFVRGVHLCSLMPRPEVIPLTIAYQNADAQNSICSLPAPSHTPEFHATADVGPPTAGESDEDISCFIH